MYLVHSSGSWSSAKQASTGQASTQASQSMHSSGSMYSISTLSYSGSSGVGWMQSTGHTSTQELSLVPMQGSAMTYAMFPVLGVGSGIVNHSLAAAGAPHAR